MKIGDLINFKKDNIIIENCRAVEYDGCLNAFKLDMVDGYVPLEYIREIPGGTEKRIIKNIIKEHSEASDIYVNFMGWYNDLKIYAVVFMKNGEKIRGEYTIAKSWEEFDVKHRGDDISFEQFYNDWGGQATKPSLIFWDGIYVQDFEDVDPLEFIYAFGKKWISTSWRRGDETVYIVDGDDPFIAPGHKNFAKWLNS